MSAHHPYMRRWASGTAVAVVAIGAVLTAGTPAGAATATPSFVQAASARGSGSATLSAVPTSPLQSGSRLVVQIGVWNARNATASAVTDSSGDRFTELLHFVAADGTEQSVWTAPVTTGAGLRPSVTAQVTSAADIGLAVLEYSGLSAVTDATVVDSQAHAVGLTGASATTVASGPTSPTAGADELAIGFYADSGFGDSLVPGAGWTPRVNVSPTGDMEFVAEDQLVGQGSQPNANVGTGKATYWLMATIVFKPATTAAPTAPGAPAAVQAVAGNGTAGVSWTAPSDGGSTITSYTVTPVTAAGPLPGTVVQGSPPATSATITGLTNGTSYTFTVSAANAVGTGPASAASNAVVPSTDPQGQWSSVQSWPLVAIHDVALNNGKYLVWDGWQDPQPTWIWDPAANTFTSTPNPTDSLFCSGQVHLPDGRVLVVGGDGINYNGWTGLKDTNVFDPATLQWTRVANMNSPRWYPSVVNLSDGRYLALSGNSTDASHWADTPEVYDPSTNTWTLLTGVSTSQIHEEEYPFTYLLPNGTVFAMGPAEDVSYVLDVNKQSWTSVGASGITNGSSVMYRPGKILYSGGAASVTSTTPAGAGTAVIDMTASAPAWRATAPMAIARVYHTLTMLADGKVLAVGGEATSDQTNVTTGVLPTETWDPSTERWTTTAPISVARNYHSTAVLMPDGRVLVAGGGHEDSLNDPGQYSAQIYSPPYLFQGARPSITSAPSSTSYGSSFAVDTPDASSITAVNLVSLGADTHQADMDQHFVPLSFTATSTGLTISAPAAAALAPVGDYMLFVVNSAGVPSMASRIHLLPAPATVPGAPSAVSAAAGNGAAQLTWTAPSDGGSPIVSYTITPYVGGAAQPTTTITGTPPATKATVNGLANGTSYSFTVTATNGVGSGAPSAASNTVTPSASVPSFVQAVSAHGHGSSLSVTPPSAIAANHRMVVEVGVWNSSSATTKSVTDTAGNVYTEVSHFKAGDGTEQSIWTAPVTAGAGTRPTIKATPSSSADLGVSVLEYAGLSTATGSAAVDAVATASGTTSGAATVASGPAGPASAANDLAIGFYTDSGFGDTLSAGASWSLRSSIAPTGDMEALVEDQPVAVGATANAKVATGGRTTWLMSAVLFKSS